MGARFTSFVAAAFVLASCRCRRPDAAPADAAAAVSEVDAGGPRAVVLLDEETLHDAAWTASGAVVALSRQRFWWFRPDGDGRAQTTVIAGGPFTHFAVAKDVDVSVVSSGAKAHVFRGAKEVSTFAIEDGENAKALSDSGTILVTELLKDGRYNVGRLYDTATGKRLAGELDSVPLLSPDGKWLIHANGVRATQTGEEVVRFPDRAQVDGKPWFDGGAMAWSKAGLHVADLAAGSVATVAAACAPEEIDQIIEGVDGPTRQAVRFCGRRVLVVRLGAGGAAPALIEIPVPAPRADDRPRIAFARDGAPLVVWGAPVGHEVDRVDLATRTLVKAPKESEPPDERATYSSGMARSDGRYRLRVESFLDRAGSVIVTDTNEKEVVRFGFTAPRMAVSAIAPFLHEHGLDLVVLTGAEHARTRIGPPATPFADVPQLYEDEHCRADEMMASQRTLTGNAAIFTPPSGDTCVCVKGGCTDPKLPPGVLARLDDRLIAAPGWSSDVTYYEQRNERGTLKLEGDLRAATFLDDGARAALLVLRGSHSEETWEVREAKLPGFELDPPVVLDFPVFAGWDLTLRGTKDTVVVVASDRQQLKAWILPRRRSDGGGAITRVEAWDGGGIVKLPDGRVELYGPGAERPVVCIDGAGALTPFASCRDQVEAKGVFRIE